MMQAKPSQTSERRLITRYAGVSLVGFATDAVVLQAGHALGLEPAGARLISLACAMHVTFVLNGLHVFGQLDRKRLPRQWASYMLTNSFGNFWNYWIFVTMVSTHWPVVGDRLFALCVSSAAAWTMNFFCTRFLVFRKVKAELAHLDLVADQEPPADEPADAGISRAR